MVIIASYNERLEMMVLFGYRADLKKWEYARQQKKQQNEQANDKGRQREGQQKFRAALSRFVS
jgi:hypothetical protein